MAITVRSGELDHVDQVLAQINQLRAAVAAAASKYHADITSTSSGNNVAGYTTTALTVNAANGDGTVGTLVALCADLKAKYNGHLADALAHKVADTTNNSTLSSGTDLTSCETFLNDLHTKYTAHIGSTTFHYVADSTNTDGSAAASSQATSDTRAGAIKTAFNAHMQTAPQGSCFNVKNP